MKKITILDSTLRDGAQGEGISFSVQDKIHICQALDELGIQYIEAGNPGSNPKDMEFFQEVKRFRSRMPVYVLLVQPDEKIQPVNRMQIYKACFRQIQIQL